jgi:hypothetical protein
MYAHDASAGSKHERANALVEQLWRDRTGVVSTQVLQELAWQVVVSVRSMPSNTTAILPMFPVDAAWLSGQLFSEVRAAERPCPKYQQ